MGDITNGGRAELVFGDPSTHLAAKRTALAFDRTAMGSDRTLMAVVRTSLSLIGFGFTIFQFFRTFGATMGKDQLPPAALGRFGLALVLLGVLLLLFGIGSTLRDARARRAGRTRLFAQGLIDEPESPIASSAMVIALLLLVVGLFAIARIAFSAGPF
jgi:putative membrane protein